MAEQFGGQVTVQDSGYGNVTIGGQGPQMENLMDRLENWIGAIERFQDRIRKDIAKEEVGTALSH